MKVRKMISMFGLLIGLCGVFGISASAQCGFSLKNNRPNFAMPPTPFSESTTPFSEPRTSLKLDGEEGAVAALAGVGDANIVGLWDVKFISAGQIVDEGFDQYHNDGTEILNDTPPPAAGNICLGVFAQKPGSPMLNLKHPSWIYDPTNTFVIGTATILENVILNPGGNTFRGTFTVQLRDLIGSPLGPDFGGQLIGTRITPN